MKTFKGILLISLMAMMLSGCDYSREYRDFLTEMDEQVIPYRKSKIIHFIDDNGKTSTMEVKKDKTFWKEDIEYDTRVVWECRKLHLSSEQCDLQFDVEIESLHWYESPNVYVQTSSGDGFLVYYDIRGLLETHDSLEINHHIYYDVAVANESNGKGSQLYYNTKYGILQVTQGDKNIFTLIP